ncbi:MAG: esterase [Janthinobacterium lividum]
MLEHGFIQRPERASKRLILLFHGVGSTFQSMIPLGKIIALVCPEATIVSVPSPDKSELGTGFQWFSVAGITEENRAHRIAKAMPAFAKTISNLQASTGTTSAMTTLIGFSQGAIMSLEAIKRQDALAARIVSLSGRFASLPDQMPMLTKVDLIHGDADPVVAPAHAVAAFDRLKQLNAAVTLALVPGLSHTIDQQVVQSVLQLLVEPT